MADAVRAFVKAATVAPPPADSSAALAGPQQQGCPVAATSSSCSSSSAAAAAADAPSSTQQQRQPASCSFADAQQAARINMDVVPNTAAASSSSAASSSLPTQRQRSSIPISAPEGGAPAHQHQQQPGSSSSSAGGTPDVWMYPSEQQFFNAMQRKGWTPSEADMSRVVAIHNSVNERAWQHILGWEALHAGDCPVPRLKRFQGRPNEFSPKARLLNFLGFKLPFDRHDWYVDRCGTEVRYVIDFYSGPPQPGAPASMHLDVRPALDSLGALWDRLRVQARWVASGRWQHE